MNTSLRKGVIVVVALVVALGVAGFVGQRAIHAVGGQATPTPFTSLAVVNPLVLANGNLPVGDPLGFRITNHLGKTQRYDWLATDEGYTVGHGSVVLANGQSAVRWTQDSKRAGSRIVVTLNGQPSPSLNVKVDAPT